MDTSRAVLLKAINADNSDQLANILTTDSWKHVNIPETLDTLTTDQAKKLFVQCVDNLNTWHKEVGDVYSENMSPDTIAASSDPAVTFVKIAQVVELLYAWTEDAARNCPPAFIEACNLLNEIILLCPDTKDGQTLQRNIIRLFERLYLQNKPFANAYMALTMPLLIDESLGPDGKDATVKRIWGLRAALTLFDYDDESSESLRDLLAHCFSCPLYMRTADNRKLLGHILAFVPHVIKVGYQQMRAQLPSTQKTAENIGDVLYRAWSYAEEPVQRIIEQVCIQDILQRGVHAAFPETFKAARKVLAELTDHKKAKGMDAMLLRSYEPIIFRALGAVNSAVRKNAALLFFDVFPLRDADLNKKDMDAVLQRQFDVVLSLLGDESPAVRETAVMGVASILDKYWEVIPAGVSRLLLNRMAQDLSLDSASTSVRAAVPAAMEFLLAQVLALPTLSAVLPSMGHLLHDKTEKVRLSMASLLEKVATIKTLDVLKIVSLDDLLARLTLDASNPQLATRLARVASPYVIPQHTDAKTLLQHVVQLLTTNEAAVLTFFSYSSGIVSRDVLAYVGILLHKAVEAEINAGKLRGEAPAAPVDAADQEDDTTGFARKRRGSKSAAKSSKTTASAAAIAVHTSNHKLMATLTRAQAVLWVALHSEQKSSSKGSADEGAVAKLVSLFENNTIADLLSSLTTTPEHSTADSELMQSITTITSSLLTIAAFVPKRKISGLPQSLWARVKAENTQTAEFQACMQCLVSWGEGQTLLEVATSSLNALIAQFNPAVRVATDERMDNFAALQAIEYVIRQVTENLAEVDLTSVTAAMSALTGCVQLAGVALQSSGREGTNYATIAQISQAAAQAWCNILMHQITFTSADLDAIKSSSQATMAVMMTVCKEVLLKAGVRFSDAVDQGTISQPQYSALAPLDSACRNIIALVCATAADFVALNLALEPATQLFVSVTSADTMRVDTPGREHAFTSLSPVEWITMDDDYTAKAAGESTIAVPVPYVPLLRLGVKLVGQLYAISEQASSVSAVQQRNLKHGLIRLLQLAPGSDDGAGASHTLVQDTMFSVANEITGASTSAAAHAYDFFEAVLPEVETTVRDTCSGLVGLSTGAVVSDTSALESPVAEALLRSVKRASSKLSVPFSQALASRLSTLSMVERGKVTAVVQCLLTLISAFVEDGCNEEARHTLRATLSRAAFEQTPAIRTVLGQLEH